MDASGTPNVVDLFAGAGGLSLGFKMAGARTVYAIESDSWAAATYRNNCPGATVDVRDIEDVSENEIKSLRDFLPDIIIGGPPCQGFSHSNVVNKDPNDPRNSLFIYFLKYVELLQPSLAVLENVPGLLTTRSTAGIPVIQLIASSFHAIGYECEWKLLEASQFGVPQRRERLFVVARRSERGLEFRWPVQTHNQNPNVATLFETHEKPAPIALWDAISDLPQCMAGDSRGCSTYSSPPTNEYQRLMRMGAPMEIHNHEPMRHTQRIVERFAQIGFGESEATVTGDLKPRKRGAAHEQSGKAYSQNNRRQRPDQPCSTIVASSHTNYIHPFLNRNFTVREMMRIQSFPDCYVAYGKRAVLSRKLSLKKGLLDDLHLDQRMQIGNAVPPLLAQALGNAVIGSLCSGRANNAA